jgi:hypothetical protein
LFAEERLSYTQPTGVAAGIVGAMRVIEDASSVVGQRGEANV